MSVWSAIDLADRNAIEKLAEQVESLRAENRELLAENQRLILAQLSEKYSGLYMAEDKGTQFLATKILDTHKNLTAQIESALRMIYGQVVSEGEKTRKQIDSVKKQLQEEIQRENRAGYAFVSQEIQKGGERLEQTVSAEADSSRKAATDLHRQTEKQLKTVIQNQTEEHDSAAASLEALRQEASRQYGEMKEMISQSLHQILEQQEITSARCSTVIADSNQNLILRMEQYCTSALEEIKNIGDKYHRMEQEEQENLERIRDLSGEMLELGERQKKVMEKLSQLCQDSDQFMEIQKSINDIWEIMKAVWVDSLLNEYQKGLEEGTEQ